MTVKLSNCSQVNSFFQSIENPIEKQSSKLLNQIEKEIQEDGPRKKWDRSSWKKAINHSASVQEHSTTLVARPR